MNERAILPDVLLPSLKVVICGTAVGRASAKQGQYYADPTNRLWGVLARVGLTTARLQPQDYRRLPEYGIGLTDLAKLRSGTDAVVQGTEFDVAALKDKIERYQPRVLGFNGKRAARAYFGREAVKYGWQAERLGECVIFVLPSTSGAARRWWDEKFWHELAGYVKSLGMSGRLE